MPKIKQTTRIAVTVSLLSLLQIWLCLVHVPWFETLNELVPPSPPLPVNRLRRDWTIRSHHYVSPLAQQLYNHQHNCELPRAHFWFRNRFGLGSDLHVWSQAACNALQHQVRIQTTGPWIWQSQADCATPTTTSSNSRRRDDDDDSLSTMACYFPMAEPDCPLLKTTHSTPIQTMNLTRGRGVLLDNACRHFREQHNVTVSAWRAAAMEYLFAALSPPLQVEANRQLRVVFPNGIVPSRLITVHVRWGDKADEMKLVPITEYIRAVKELAEDQSPVHVYLSTTDPAAVYEFVSQSPNAWNIHVDAYFQEYYKQQSFGKYNANPLLSLEHNGEPGFMALASLLVALEANAFVLTTASNWSRLLNELRQTILDSECNHCTRMIDLRPGEW